MLNAKTDRLLFLFLNIVSKFCVLFQGVSIKTIENNY